MDAASTGLASQSIFFTQLLGRVQLLFGFESRGDSGFSFKPELPFLSFFIYRTGDREQSKNMKLTMHRRC